MVEYTKSIVSYFDILGFKKIVEEAKNPEDVARKLRLLKRSSLPSEGIAEAFGNTFTNFSDLILRTVPILPNPKLMGNEGLLYCEFMDLVYIQVELISEGVLLRGAITIGDIFVNDDMVFGPALVRAYELESKVAVAPRVIIDPRMFQQLEEYPALRKHDIEAEMQYYLRVLKKDADGVWFVDYLRAFFGTGEIEGFLRFLKAHKELIVNSIASATTFDSVITKYGWLVTYHNDFVNILNEIDLQELGTSREAFLIGDNLSPLLPSITEVPET
jgi:hypothetical protein